jgi:hypothetical protein
MKPIKLMVARFPGGRSEDPDICDWITTTVITAREDPRITEIVRYRIDDTPITMGRNACLEAARNHGCDMLLMVDSDMSPDLYLPSNPYCECHDHTARPFFDSSLQFLWELRKKGECGVIGAPYCGPPPYENVYVFHWATHGNGPEDEADMRLEQFSRERAASMTGITEVAALPTGVILIDMDCLERISPPYTYYEWTDHTESGKASTEDVTFTRDLSLNGIKQYCNWDAWAGHWKMKRVGKPRVIDASMIGRKFRECLIKEMEQQRVEKEYGKEAQAAITPRPAGGGSCGTVGEGQRKILRDERGARLRSAQVHLAHPGGCCGEGSEQAPEGQNIPGGGS